MSVVMPKAPKPTLMSGNAHPQAMAAVRGNTATHVGLWNIEIRCVVTSYASFLLKIFFASAKIHKKSRKPNVSPIIFLTKAPRRRKETEAADFRVFKFI